MYMVGENCSAQQMHTRFATCMCDGALHVLDRGLVDATNPLPGMPGDVRV
jgi:hypothetical protein